MSQVIELLTSVAWNKKSKILQILEIRNNQKKMEILSKWIATAEKNQLE